MTGKANPTQPTLPSFEEQSVAKCSVRITKAGDGLSAALEVAPEALFLGDEQYYVLSGVVRQVNHKEKDGVITRVHTIEATGITGVDGELATKLLRGAAEETERLRAEAAGQLALDAEKQAEQREREDRERDDARNAAESAAGNVSQINGKGKAAK